MAHIVTGLGFRSSSLKPSKKVHKQLSGGQEEENRVMPSSAAGHVLAPLNFEICFA